MCVRVCVGGGGGGEIVKKKNVVGVLWMLGGLGGPLKDLIVTMSTLNIG